MRGSNEIESPIGDVAMNRLEILERLNAEAPVLRARYRIQSLAVFGSMARGDDHEGSDVDVLVAFEGKATFDNFMGLKLDLEEMFGRSVDLLTPKCLRPEMQAEIDKEAILVP
ncbi:MAG: nucleotidyltransferase family protein [Isosphaeraceae bacterium]